MLDSLECLYCVHLVFTVMPNIKETQLHLNYVTQDLLGHGRLSKMFLISERHTKLLEKGKVLQWVLLE